jgi:hypothetical protein
LAGLTIGKDAAPLSVQATFYMSILLIILAVTLGLAWRARVVQKVWRPAEAEDGDQTGLIDATTRASLLVLFSLLGLMALGMMYGNVLGAGNTSH